MIYKRKNKQGKESKDWHYDFRVNKKRYRGATSTKKKRNAQEFHDDLKELKKRETRGIEVPIKKYNIPTAKAQKITKKKATKKTNKRKAREPMIHETNIKKARKMKEDILKDELLASQRDYISALKENNAQLKKEIGRALKEISHLKTKIGSTK